MGFVDHDHDHQWQRLGLIAQGGAVAVVYQCRTCDAWTRRELNRSIEVPFREGTVWTDGEDR